MTATPNRLRLILSRTPRFISGDLRRACNVVVLNAEPGYVQVRPAPFAVMNQCHYNVHNAIQLLGGGKVVMGWIVAVWSGVWAEFIAHSVWCQPDGNVLCITPNKYDDERILFLPDQSLDFDVLALPTMIGTRMVLLSDHPDVRALAGLILVDRQIWMLDGAPIPSASLDGMREHEVATRSRELIRRTALRTLPHDAPCICDSGRRFSKCCREPMRQEGKVRR